MNHTLKFIFQIFFFVEFITGILGNGFIALGNISGRFKRRKISLVDHILTALAVSRLTLLWSMVISVTLNTLCPHLLMNSEMVRVSVIICIVTNHFSIWIATCLSIFYFLKIASFSNSPFLYLKWRIKKVILVTLLVSLVPLVLNTVVKETYVDFFISGYNGHTPSNSMQFSKVSLFTNSMFMLIPFILSLIGFYLLMFSLWKHHRKMQQKAQIPRDASTTAHKKALKIVLAFLMLYAMCLLILVIKISSSELMENDVIILCDYTSGIAFPSGNSFVLILGNNKLRHVTLSVPWWLRCKSKDVETFDP
ncbi:LOW QUALITY PROTEIN: taste receptor type 2 member 110-like [Nannospalax galili]|uniref:LOW QUALITY PROTEIN: taste receptor type 2 member 110-like n=1 Tax=Nannospalax galili TaxID=1026970 RepID=UPI00111BFFE8|nr:LOW QUALITY PROTEIN: taste receptor type 2 member 110-like [Nannospalax galili]